MRYIYIMDSEMPTPENREDINTWEEVNTKYASNLQTTYTQAVLNWAKEEFDKMFSKINCHPEFNLNDIFIAFFSSDYFGVPEGFFRSKDNLVAIKLNKNDTGKSADIQKFTIHELTHASTGAHSLVGLSITEGLAVLAERLYDNANGIPHQDEEEKDEGYIFGKNLVNSIIFNVYDNNLDDFFKKVKRGQEVNFLNDIDVYLKSKNILYSARDLLKLCSILFYAKKLPKNPFQEYLRSEDMEFLRQEILHCLDKTNTNDNPSFYRYINSIKRINIFCDSLSSFLDDYETFSATLDRELGKLLVLDKNSLLNNRIITNAIKQTLQITNLTNLDFDFEEYFEKNFTDSKSTHK